MPKVEPTDLEKLEQRLAELEKYFHPIANPFVPLYDSAVLPKRATKQSAAYDVRAFFDLDFDNYESYYQKILTSDFFFSLKSSKSSYEIRPSDIIKIPTGIACNLPEGIAINVRGRSGLNSRGLLVLLGVVDSDYYPTKEHRAEIFVVVQNTSAIPILLKHGDRIAQLELHRPVLIEDMVTTERSGGFGHTGL